MPAFDIENYQSKKSIKEIINSLETRRMKRWSHGYKEFKDATISEATKQSSISMGALGKSDPAVALIDVVLAANRSYNKQVEPRIERLIKNPDKPKSFKELSSILVNRSFSEFCTSFEFHRDKRKYETLKHLLASINKMRRSYPAGISDSQLLHKWGKAFKANDYKSDSLGNIPYVGIATLQHLRIRFGINTVKPDRQVKNVLKKKFRIKRLSDSDAIIACEQIAKILGRRVIEIDQILVKYGSGYLSKKRKPSFHSKSCNNKTLFYNEY